MTEELDLKLNELKKFSQDLKVKKLNKKIYNLNIGKEYFKTLKQQDLIYIHVKLHNALSYKKPFTNIEDIKKKHDELITFLDYHPNMGDLLDKDGI